MDEIKLKHSLAECKWQQMLAVAVEIENAADDFGKSVSDAVKEENVSKISDILAVYLDEIQDMVAEFEKRHEEYDSRAVPN